jgi:polyvinyl alcohol dehydrogenase (cytochrome)
MEAPRKRRKTRRWLAAAAALGLMVGLVSAAPVSAVTGASGGPQGVGGWPMAGGNISDTRSNPLATTITPGNASQLSVKWTYTSHGDVSATPTVVGGAVYFPDWGGYLDKVNAATGQLIWAHQISDYDGIAGSDSRTSPAYEDGVVYIADRVGANLIAVSAATGDLIWIKQLETHPAAVVTESPSVYDGVVYEGMSSGEEIDAVVPGYSCCTFRGSISAVNAKTGAVLWKTYAVPDNGGQAGGYSGGAIWGGTPVIDPVHKLIYVTTGQNYTIPQSATDCENAGGTTQACLSPDDHIDSVLALDMRTGSIKWSYGPVNGFDTFNFACQAGVPTPNCPIAGTDLDMTDGAHEFTIAGPHGTRREVIGGGNKNGTYYLLDALTGKLIWQTNAGPASDSGGILWGSSEDGKRIYIGEADWAGIPYTLPNGTTITSSSWAALDPQTGKILWQTADPSGGYAWGAVSSANGVVYASATDGTMYAMNGATGQILWSYKGVYSSNAGAAIVGGTVYWGNGYAESFPGSGLTGSTTTGTFYAFSLNGQ